MLKEINYKGQKKNREDGEIITKRKNLKMVKFEITKLYDAKSARR